MSRFILQLRIMLVSLRRSGARALIAVGAVGAGIAAVMVNLALSRGADEEMRSISGKLGRNLFVVAAARVLPMPGRGDGWVTSSRLRVTDGEAIRSAVGGVTAVVPLVESSLPVRYGDDSAVTAVRGTSPDYAKVRRFAVSEGRLLDDADGMARRRVAVLGATVVRKLNRGSGMTGETVWIGAVPFEVVGELRSRGIGIDGLDEDDLIVIPLQTAQRRLFNSEALSSLVVQVGEKQRMEGAMQRSRDVIRAAHELDPDAADDVSLMTMIRANEIARRSSAFTRGLAAVFAAVTLLTGGVGVLAVTLLNVRERTAEIGLRMAIGARRRDIAGLFAAEACLLSLCGGIAGVVAGFAAVAFLKKVTGWQMVIAPAGVAAPFFLSLALGLAFGLLPALRASGVTPVEALRDV